MKVENGNVALCTVLYGLLLCLNCDVWCTSMYQYATLHYNTICLIATDVSKNQKVKLLLSLFTSY